MHSVGASIGLISLGCLICLKEIDALKKSKNKVFFFFFQESGLECRMDRQPLN